MFRAIGWAIMTPAALAISHAVTSDAARSINLADRLRPPSLTHLLGTDHLGRDVALRLVHGAAPTVLLAMVALVVSSAIGVSFGLAASLAGRRVRGSILGVCDCVLVVPMVVSALCVAAALGQGSMTGVVAMAVVGWTPYCRVTAQLSSSVLNRDFAEASRAAGASRSFVARRHVLPNIVNPLAGLAASRAANFIIGLSAISYLGIGPQPPSADWGVTLSNAQPYTERAPWAVAAPAIAIVLVAVAAMHLARDRERTGVAR